MLQMKTQNITGKCTSTSYNDYVYPQEGDSTYERDGDACRKFWIKPLTETDLGMAQAFFDPKKRPIETQTIYIYLYFSRATLNETFTAKHDGVLPRTP